MPLPYKNLLEGKTSFSISSREDNDYLPINPSSNGKSLIITHYLNNPWEFWMLKNRVKKSKTLQLYYYALAVAMASRNARLDY